MAETSQLLDAARSGDRQALDELFARHARRILAFLRVHMSPTLMRRIPPEDVLQETLLEAARKLGGFEPRGSGSLYRWLVAIARFKASEAARRRVEDALLVVDPLHDATGAATAAERADRAEHLRAALATLPEAQAAAVRLRYLEGASTRETAERLGRSDAAVKMLLARGFAALAERLGGRI